MQAKQSFLPKNKISIPNPNNFVPDIDDFLDQANLPMNWTPRECILQIHTSVYKKLLDKANMTSGVPDNYTRYRDYLLVIEDRQLSGLIYIRSIFHEIENLRILQADSSRWFTQNEMDRLKYLIDNRYIKDQL